MGALRLFVSIACTLHAQPARATRDQLDELAAAYKGFAYIGNRKTLNRLVRAQAGQLQKRLLEIPDSELDRLVETDNELASALRTIKRKGHLGTFDMAAEWFGREKWNTNSGVFPDFLLALDYKSTFGNGAFLELKDTKDDSIASFNSTLPLRLKSLAEIKRISRKSMVAHAARLFDYPLSVNPDYLSQQRTCLYLVRTRSQDKNRVRISLVEGSFFETLPQDQLLEKVWEQILDASGMPSSEQPPIIEFLRRLDQSDIAQSREIDRASVKPRLRIMAEVHSDANLHAYPEITPGTVNLVVKRESGYDEHWVVREFVKDGLESARVIRRGPEVSVVLTVNSGELEFRYLIITHKRNGDHLVLQYRFS